MNTPKFLLYFAIPFTLAALGLHGQVIVSWGAAEDIVTGQVGTIGGEGSQSIDFGTPSNPTIGPGYYPNNEGKNPVFYLASYAPVTGGLDVRLLNGTPDEFRLAMSDNSAPQEVEGTIALVWTKDGDGTDFGFLNGGDTLPTSLVSLDATFGTNGSSVPGGSTFRWVIRLDDTFYASESSPGGPAKSLPDPGAIDWFSYSPDSDISVFGSTAESIASFENVTAVGFAFEFSQTSSGNIFIIPELRSFTAEGAVIPEPSSAFLLGAVSILGVLVYRRRRA